MSLIRRMNCIVFIRIQVKNKYSIIASSYHIIKINVISAWNNSTLLLEYNSMVIILESLPINRKYPQKTINITMFFQDNLVICSLLIVQK